MFLHVSNKINWVECYYTRYVLAGPTPNLLERAALIPPLTCASCTARLFLATVVAVFVLLRNGRNCLGMTPFLGRACTDFATLAICSFLHYDIQKKPNAVNSFKNLKFFFVNLQVKQVRNKNDVIHSKREVRVPKG